MFFLVPLVAAAASVTVSSVVTATTTGVVLGKNLKKVIED